MQGYSDNFQVNIREKQDNIDQFQATINEKNEQVQKLQKKNNEFRATLDEVYDTRLRKKWLGKIFTVLKYRCERKKNQRRMCRTRRNFMI